MLIVGEKPQQCGFSFACVARL